MTGNCHVRFGKGSLPRDLRAVCYFSLLSMGAVFALFAAFFRHGQTSNGLEVTQFGYALIANVPRLSNVLQSNESVI